MHVDQSVCVINIVLVLLFRVCRMTEVWDWVALCAKVGLQRMLCFVNVMTSFLLPRRYMHVYPGTCILHIST